MVKNIDVSLHLCSLGYIVKLSISLREWLHQKPYAQMCGYIRVMLSFAIVPSSQPIPEGFQGEVEGWVLKMHGTPFYGIMK